MNITVASILNGYMGPWRGSVFHQQRAFDECPPVKHQCKQPVDYHMTLSPNHTMIDIANSQFMNKTESPNKKEIREKIIHFFPPLP